MCCSMVLIRLVRPLCGQQRALLHSMGVRTLKMRAVAGARQFSQEKKDEKVAEKSTAQQQQSGQLQRSILEEVLIHEKKKPTTFSEKAAEATTNTFLYACVAAGIAALGGLAYVLGEQFFAEDSPQKIFGRALSIVQDDPRCMDLFGNGIKGFGEETSRGRRRHVASHKYTSKEGLERIRVMFHVKGDRGEGIAQVETEMRDGDWETRFLYVETSGRPKTTHVLIDNR